MEPGEGCAGRVRHRADRDLPSSLSPSPSPLTSPAPPPAPPHTPSPALHVTAAIRSMMTVNVTLLPPAPQGVPSSHGRRRDQRRLPPRRRADRLRAPPTARRAVWAPAGDGGPALGISGAASESSLRLGPGGPSVWRADVLGAGVAASQASLPRFSTPPPVLGSPDQCSLTVSPTGGGRSPTGAPGGRWGGTRPCQPAPRGPAPLPRPSCSDNLSLSGCSTGDVWGPRVSA